MIHQNLNGYKLILASGSPRRHAFFKTLELDFEIRLKPVEEIYPPHLQKTEITDYLSKLKAASFLDGLSEKEILITSDTIVWHQQKAIGKPKDEADAIAMLSNLSGETHEVVTSICFTLNGKQQLVNSVTKVTFKVLTLQEIEYYIHTYKPLDKAGSYGIQEWIGDIGITNIEGSYNNVVGLPTHLLYQTLNTLVSG